MHFPLSILVYGRVLAQPDPLFPETVDACRFAQQLRLLKRWFRVLPLDLALRRLAAGSLPARAACITFDGAYADHASVALPILQRTQLPATFFIASGMLDGGYSWRDTIVELVRNAAGPRLCLARGGFGLFDIGCNRRRRAVIDTLVTALSALPANERARRIRALTRSTTPTMLTSDQLIALHRAGMLIGAHSVTQQPLATLSNADARAEIHASRASLEHLVQAPVRLFSYPNGVPGRDFEERHGNMLRSAGFDAAVSCARGAARAHSDLFALPRCTPWEGTGAGFLLRMGRNMFTEGSTTPGASKHHA